MSDDLLSGCPLEALYPAARSAALRRVPLGPADPNDHLTKIAPR